jgi:hypothetical protein
MVLRKTFGPKREKITGDWRKLHSEELIRVIISRKMRWAGHVARTGLK